MTAPKVRASGPSDALGPAEPQTEEWSVEISRADDGFELLGSEWTDLYARSGAATPFQSLGWLGSWWESYGTKGGLRIVLVRRHGRLVAALPLVRRRRYGHTVLLPVGDELSDHVDVLVDEQWADLALPLLAEALLLEERAAAIDLSEVRPTAMAWRLADHWPAAQARLPSSPCMVAPAAPFDEHLKRVSKNRRRKYRRAVTKAAAEGLVVRTVDRGETDDAVTTMLRLHERQWRGRGITPEHLRPRFARHLRTAMATMVGTGEATLTEYVLDGKVVAATMMVFGHGLAGAYLYGIEPSARDRVDFSPLMISRDFELAVAKGMAEMSLLRGAEEHKEAWGLELVPNERLVLGGRNRLRSASYIAVVRCRARAVTVVKRHFPGLRPVLQRLRHFVLR